MDERLTVARGRSPSTGRMLFALAAVTVGLACGDGRTEQVDAGRVMSFEKTRVRIATARDTVVVHAEVARSAEQRTMGLMERTSLAADSGMLFVYETDQPGSSGFWMFRTRIPLDIAFADSTGRIGAILTMQPCTASLAAGCPSYNPHMPYRYALEVNAGFFARRGIGVGSRLVLELSGNQALRRGSARRPDADTHRQTRFATKTR